MSALTLPVSGDPGRVWRVGFEPDPWEWVPWQYTTDNGRFNGRWDDQAARFRTLSTSESLLGCFLELLAPRRPNDVAFAELAAIIDDGSDAQLFPDPERGAIGMTWLSDRLYGHAAQAGRYAEVTEAQALGFLAGAGVFARLGIPPRDVDAALLKDATKRDITCSVARFSSTCEPPRRGGDGVRRSSRRVRARYESPVRVRTCQAEPMMRGYERLRAFGRYATLQHAAVRESSISVEDRPSLPLRM